MKATLSMIREAATGCARITEQEDGICFYRFTEEQEEFYRTYNTDFYYKTFATAGVRLEFVTDSASLSIETVCKSASSRKFVYHDIFCNGKAIDHFGGAINSQKGYFGGSYDLGEGLKTVQIYFPWMAQSVLRSLELDDGASFSPVKRPTNMLIFGDSITHGYDANYPSQTYSSILSDKLNANAINKGIGGEIFWPELAALPEDFTPDLINVAYGTNDWSVCSFEELENNCRGFYHNLRKTYPDTKIVMLSPIWRDDMNREDSACPFRQVAQLLRTIAEEIGNAVLIDCFDFVPPENRCFCDDLLHPSDEGFRHYAEGLIRCYEALGLNK